MPLYDLMLLLDPNAPEDRQAQIAKDTQATIEGAGTLVGAHEWGTRALMYEMDHRPEAAYHLLRFEGGNDLLDSLNHTLRITDGVMRYRIVRLKPGAEGTTESPRPFTPEGAGERGERGERRGRREESGRR